MRRKKKSNLTEKQKEGERGRANKNERKILFSHSTLLLNVKDAEFYNFSGFEHLYFKIFFLYQEASLLEYMFTYHVGPIMYFPSPAEVELKYLLCLFISRHSSDQHFPLCACSIAFRTLQHNAIYLSWSSIKTNNK